MSGDNGRVRLVPERYPDTFISEGVSVTYLQGDEWFHFRKGNHIVIVGFPVKSDRENIHIQQWGDNRARTRAPRAKKGKTT